MSENEVPEGFKLNVSYDWELAREEELRDLLELCLFHWEVATELVVGAYKMQSGDPVALAHATLEATDAIEEAMQKSIDRGIDQVIPRRFNYNYMDLTRMGGVLRRDAEKILQLADYPVGANEANELASLEYKVRDFLMEIEGSVILGGRQITRYLDSPIEGSLSEKALGTLVTDSSIKAQRFEKIYESERSAPVDWKSVQPKKPEPVRQPLKPRRSPFEGPPPKREGPRKKVVWPPKHRKYPGFGPQYRRDPSQYAAKFK